jgi:uncharacterized protein (DUF1330 family)
MPVYLVGNFDIHDREGYSKYEVGFMEVFQKFNVKLLAVDDNQKTIEGEWPTTRTVIMEFLSKNDAMAWYESDAYQNLKQHRLDASSGDSVLVAGFPS